MRPLLCCLLFLLVLWAAPAYADRVISVHDGDTFTLENGDRIRLGGIDALELAQPYGIEARGYLKRLVMDRDVRLECDGTMSYNRRVCSAFVVGLDIQKELVRWGLAYDYARYSGGRYNQAEAFAKKMRRGVWTLLEGRICPWDYRHRKR